MAQPLIDKYIRLGGIAARLERSHECRRTRECAPDSGPAPRPPLERATYGWLTGREASELVCELGVVGFDSKYASIM